MCVPSIWFSCFFLFVASPCCLSVDACMVFYIKASLNIWTPSANTNAILLSLASFSHRKHCLCVPSIHDFAFGFCNTADRQLSYNCLFVCVCMFQTMLIDFRSSSKLISAWAPKSRLKDTHTQIYGQIDEELCDYFNMRVRMLITSARNSISVESEQNERIKWKQRQQSAETFSWLFSSIRPTLCMHLKSHTIENFTANESKSTQSANIKTKCKAANIQMIHV